MYRKKENKIDLKLLRRTSKACSCLFSSSYVTDASDRILRIYFQLKSYPAVFSSNFIHSRSNYGKLSAQNYGFGQTQIETKRAHKNLKKPLLCWVRFFLCLLQNLTFAVVYVRLKSCRERLPSS